MHQSATAKVILAVDEDESAECKEVALKLMSDRASFEREMSELLRVRLSVSKHAISALRFHPDIQLDDHFTSCIVLPRGDRTLADAITHAAFAGKMDDPIAICTMREIMLQLSSGLLHLHENSGAVHCDFKPLNAMSFGQTWKIIDFDSTVLIGQAAGAKYSSLVAPPEILVLDRETPVVRDPSSDCRLLADPSYDVWSFGVVLYNLLFGRALFLADLNDNLDADQLAELFEWDTVDCKAYLDRVQTDSFRANLGKELIYWMLQPVPTDRPSMQQIAAHPFFADDPRCNRLPCVDFPWDCHHTAPAFKPSVILGVSNKDPDADAFFARLRSSCAVISRSLVEESVKSEMESSVSVNATPSSDVACHLSDVEVNQLSVVQTQGKDHPPRVAAFCFGVDFFESDCLPNLSSCCNDARGFADGLRSIPSPFSASVCLCENANFETFCFAKDAFMSHIQACQSTLKIVVVFLASHGCQFEDELFLAVGDTEMAADMVVQQHGDLLKQKFISVSDLLSRLRANWAGPLVLIADTCRIPYPNLSITTRKLSEQLQYYENILCCFSTSVGAAANDGVSYSVSPFTSTLLRCLFVSGVPLRTAILDACTILGKEETPSCTVMKFPDIPLVPAFCEVVFIGQSCSVDDEWPFEQLQKAIARHPIHKERVVAIFRGTAHPDLLERIGNLGVRPLFLDDILTAAVSSKGAHRLSKQSMEAHSKIVAAWESCSGPECAF